MKRLLRKWIQKLKFKNVQFIISVSFVLIVLLMLSVGWILYQKFMETARSNAALTNQQLIEQVNYNIESYLRSMRQTFELADYNIRKGARDQESALWKKLEELISSREDIVSLSLFSTDAEWIAVTPKGDKVSVADLKVQSWFKNAVSNPDELNFSPPHVQRQDNGQSRMVLTISRGITINREGRIVHGVLAMDVNFETIASLSRRVSLGKEGYIYIVDSDGNLVYYPERHSDSQAGVTENFNVPLSYSYGTYYDRWSGKARMLTVQNVNPVGWKVVGVSFKQEYSATNDQVKAWIFGLIGLAIAIIISVSIYLSLKISKPIRRLKQSMSRVEYGDFSIVANTNGISEIQLLAKRFNTMVSRIRELMDQVSSEQEAKRKSDFEVLQAQINPHFLYNTLNSVVRMVGSGKNEDIVNTITTLSKYFRTSLSKGQSIVTVREELEHVRYYLIIQSIRFKNKFRYEIVAPEELMPCLSLKLILQPIVENAIQHGIEPMVDEGFISIRVNLSDEGKLIFIIKDNGVGMSAHRVESIMWGAMPTPHSEEGSGLGLRNVHQRITLQYGVEYGLRVESEREEGTIVTLSLPIIKENK
ncbi:sensor histidine kinase [Cohnella endophytica]|uniref:histidine kinase n=1 Tax=Cohnella endophytica TaxID=2419778 RepID=A0A494XV02_9BACL|nr:sensor histidine kinase [Cohnella endophytica]RKP54410.1 sensor histidine kinase [Cohnella endophytica]